MQIKKLKCKSCKKRWIPRVPKPVKCPRCMALIKYVVAFVFMTTLAHAQLQPAVNVEKAVSEVKKLNMEGVKAETIIIPQFTEEEKAEINMMQEQLKEIKL